MFIGLVSCFVRACLRLLVRERDTAKIGKPSSRIALPLLVWAHITPDESDVARPQCPATCDGGHATLKESHGQRKIGYKTKVLQTEVRSKKAELRNSGSMQRITHGGDEFFVVERLHEKCDRADGHCGGTRG